MNLRQKSKQNTTKMTVQKEKQNSCKINSDSKFNLLPNVVLTPLKLIDSNSKKIDASSNLCNKLKADTTADILNSTTYSDPKLKMACKVRVLRMNFDEGIKSDLQRKGLKTPSPRSDCKQNIMCKVQLRKINRTKKVKVIVKDQNNTNKPPESQSSQTILDDEQIKQNGNTTDKEELDKFNLICKVHLERVDLSRLTDGERSSKKITSDSNRKQNNTVLDRNRLDPKVILTPLDVQSSEIEIDTGQENKAKKQDADRLDKHHKKLSEFNSKISASDESIKQKELTKESLKSREEVNTSVANCECCTADNCALHNEIVPVSNKAEDRNTEINSKEQKMKNKFFKQREKDEEKTKAAATLSGRNQTVPKKRGRNKKTPLNDLNINIPKSVVEKCMDRIPVYKKDLDGLSNIDERKSNAYEFEFDSEDAEDTGKPAKTKKPRKPRAPRKKTTISIYDKRIKEIMNKLAITVNSNKIIAKEIPKTKKDTNGMFPVKTVRIQAKQPRVRFKDIESNENANVNNKETIKSHTDTQKPNNNLNITTKPVPQTACDNVVLPQVRTSNSKDTFDGFNDHSLRLSRIRKNIMNKYLQKQELDTNAASDQLSLSIAHDTSATPIYNQSLNNEINHQGISNEAGEPRNSSHLVVEKDNSLVRQTSIDFEGELNGQTARPKSACSVYSDINNEIVHRDFSDDDDGDDSLPSFANEVDAKHANPWRFSPNNSTSRDNSTAAENVHSKSNDLVTAETENDISFVRPESACSAISKATNLYESLNDDDPYFGFDDDHNEDDIVRLSPLSETDKDRYQNRRKQTLLNATLRKTGSPWRYSPRNVSYNPHFVRIKNNGLPVVNQDPVLDYTFDENIRQHYPILNNSERSEVTIRKSPKQKSILNYITTSKDITENKENVPRASIFDNEDFSPIKIRDTPKRPEAKKVKRNILGALNDNIIIHSVQIISTPLRSNDKKQIESPNLSAIFDDIKNDHAAFHDKTTFIRTRRRGNKTLLKATDEQDIIIRPNRENDNGPNSYQNLELEIRNQDNIEDKFHGFRCTHIETAKVISNKLNEFLDKQKAIIDKETERRVETFFGFETVIDDSIDMYINNNNNNKSKDDPNGAKPYRFSIGKAKKEYHKKKKAQEKTDEEARKQIPEEVLDSEDDFDLPTPVPEDETLKGGLFEEIEVEKPNRTYVSKRRRRRAVSVETEPDEEHDKLKKRRKDQPTKQEIEELEKWASEFNKMCEEVEQFPLEIE